MTARQGNDALSGHVTLRQLPFQQVSGFATPGSSRVTARTNPAKQAAMAPPGDKFRLPFRGRAGIRLYAHSLVWHDPGGFAGRPFRLQQWRWWRRPRHTASPAAQCSPVASAGPNQTVDAATVVTLNGSGSNDPDGTIASYAWTQTAGTCRDAVERDGGCSPPSPHPGRDRNHAHFFADGH